MEVDVMGGGVWRVRWGRGVRRGWARGVERLWKRWEDGVYIIKVGDCEVCGLFHFESRRAGRGCLIN